MTQAEHSSKDHCRAVFARAATRSGDEVESAALRSRRNFGGAHTQSVHAHMAPQLATRCNPAHLGMTLCRIERRRVAGPKRNLCLRGEGKLHRRLAAVQPAWGRVSTVNFAALWSNAPASFFPAHGVGAGPSASPGQSKRGNLLGHTPNSHPQGAFLAPDAVCAVRHRAVACSKSGQEVAKVFFS